jgi:phosphonopyruvate decarboxylase
MSDRQLSVEGACRVLADLRGDELAVLTMSAIAFWPDTRDDDYRLMGLMGGAAGIGLGIALGLPDREIWVIDGDGSLLMQLGALTAVASAAPANLTHVVLDNAIYAISGAQPVPVTVDWQRLALAAGYRSAVTCASRADLRDALAGDEEGPRLVAVRCASRRPHYPSGAFAVDPRQEAHGLRAALAAARKARP